MRCILSVESRQQLLRRPLKKSWTRAGTYCQLYPDNMLASRDQKQRHYMHVCVIDHDKREINRKVENAIQDLKMRAQMGISSTGLLCRGRRMTICDVTEET